MNENQNFKTESIYASLDIPDNTMEFYIRPDRDQLPKFSPLNYEKISDLTIKNKIQNIQASLKSLNIDIKTEWKNNPLLIDSFLSSESNKNYLISSLLQFIIDLIWKIKEDNIQSASLSEKIRKLENQNLNLNKTIKKLTVELEDNQKGFRKMQIQSNLEKEKFDKKQKYKIDESLESKNENKKLTNMVNVLKNEVKKKECEYSKLQEKYKKFLTSGRKEENFNLNQPINLQDINSHSLNIFNQGYYEEIENRQSTLINQNTYLFELLLHIKKSIENLSTKCLNCLESINYNNYNNLFIDVINIKEHLFSIHLLQRNALEEFNLNFLHYFGKFEEMLNIILENNQKPIKVVDVLSLRDQVNSQTMEANKKTDIIKNFKKWSLNTCHNNSYCVDNLQKSSSLVFNNSIKKSSSKWFDEIEKSKQIKEIKYEYDENTVIKCESDNEDIQMENNFNY
jgi:hypothetical protein